MEGEFSRERSLLGGVLTVVLLLELDWRDVADRGVQALVVEPVDPGQGRQLEVVHGAERAVTLDALVLVEADDGLGEGGV